MNGRIEGARFQGRESGFHRSVPSFSLDTLATPAMRNAALALLCLLHWAPRSDLGFWFFAGKLYIREVREILGVVYLEAVICVSELDSVYVDTLVELLDLGVIDVVCVG